MVKACCAFMILLAAAQSVRAQTALTPAKPKPATAADPQKYAVALERWTAQMHDALSAGQLEEARARAMDILDVDPDNVRAWHALALTHVGSRELSKAATAIEKAMEKSKGKPNRALVLNFGMIMISNRNPMRAARFLLDYLQSRSSTETVDETVLNALAVALTNADDNARKAPLFAQAGKAYEQFNAKLESTRSGQKRWGLEWLPEAEARRKISTWQRQESDLDQLRRRAYDAAAEVSAARRNLAKVKGQAMLGNVNRGMVANAEQRVTNAQRAYASARQAYQVKDATVARPQFPKAMATVALDDAKPSGETAHPFAKPEQVAAAAPSRLRLKPQAPVAPTPPRKSPPAAETDAEVEEVESRTAPELFVRKDSSRRMITRKAGAFPVGPDLYVTAASAVRGATDITLSDTTGQSFKGQVLRVNEDAGVALVRSPGRKSPYLRLADTFRGGVVQCISLAPGLFETRVEQIPGSLRIKEGGATLSLQREPRRCGTPLVVNKQVVGVQLAERGLGSDDLPVATLEDLKALCGPDLPTNATPFGEPAQHVYELVAVCETK